MPVKKPYQMTFVFNPVSPGEIDVFQRWDFDIIGSKESHFVTGSLIYCFEYIQIKMINEWGMEYAS